MQPSVVVSVEAQEEFSKKFEMEFSLISYLSSSTLEFGAWLLDNGTTRDMTRTQE